MVIQWDFPWDLMGFIRIYDMMVDTRPGNFSDVALFFFNGP